MAIVFLSRKYSEVASEYSLLRKTYSLTYSLLLVSVLGLHSLFKATQAGSTHRRHSGELNSQPKSRLGSHIPKPLQFCHGIISLQNSEQDLFLPTVCSPPPGCHHSHFVLDILYHSGPQPWASRCLGLQLPEILASRSGGKGFWEL